MGSVRFFYATGVFDHNVSNGQVYVDFSGVLGQMEGNGDQGWTEPTSFGGSNFVFVEDNDFASIVSGRIQTIADCTHAGRVVVRYNRGNDTQQHGTYGGTGRARGCRAMEIYGNTFNGGNFNAVFLNSGTTLIWGNMQTQPAGGSYCCFITLHAPRSNNNSTTWNTPTPNGWGYCGTGFSGTGSNWDGNTDAPSGYPCLDQLGRGQGDLLAERLHHVIYGGIGNRERPPGEPPGHVYPQGGLLGDRYQDALSMRVGEYLDKLLHAVQVSAPSRRRFAGICGSREVTGHEWAASNPSSGTTPPSGVVVVEGEHIVDFMLCQAGRTEEPQSCASTSRTLSRRSKRTWIRFSIVVRARTNGRAAWSAAQVEWRSQADDGVALRHPGRSFTCLGPLSTSHVTLAFDV
jgi:hypothetical protein